MSLTYTIPDIHGRYDLLQIAIDKIVSHAAGRPAKVVTLGDYVDRGPCSRQVIERLMQWEFDHLSLVSLKGNHEAMMWQTCNNLLELERWLENGGDQTLRSYGNLSSDKFDLSLVPSSHLAWIASLPAMHVDQHRVFVHAGVDPEVSLNQQDSQTLLWKRYRRGFKKGHGRRHVVHGHDADPSAPIRTTGKTNLDAMAWRTGHLTIGIFENERPGGPAEVLDVTG